jgi:hypothetical protein
MPRHAIAFTVVVNAILDVTADLLDLFLCLTAIGLILLFFHNYSLFRKLFLAKILFAVFITIIHIKGFFNGNLYHSRSAFINAGFYQQIDGDFRQPMGRLR